MAYRALKGERSLKRLSAAGVDSEASSWGRKDYINMGILQMMISGIPLMMVLEPGCRVLVFMGSFGPISSEDH